MLLLADAFLVFCMAACRGASLSLCFVACRLDNHGISGALHADGRVGNCQPGGGAPENNFDENSTSNFCVG
jgi:hypothetical protein